MSPQSAADRRGGVLTPLLPQGETLAERLGRGPVDAETALGILEQLLVVLEPVHESGAIHGRITPEVIHLGPVVLADDEVSDHPGYMAPEQISGTSLDARADVFALGVIGCEMLTGTNPALLRDAPAGTTPYRLVYECSVQVDKAFAAHLSDDVRLVLMRATAKDPAARFDSAQSFLQALRWAAAGGGTTSPVEPEIVATFCETGGLLEAMAECLFSIRRNLPSYLVATMLLVAGVGVVLFAILGR